MSDHLRLQGPSLTALPEGVLSHLCRFLGHRQLATVRLVCKQLADVVRQQVTSAKTSQRLTSQHVAHLDRRFSALTSLTCMDPVSTYRLATLTGLTMLSLSTEIPAWPEEFCDVDFGPLEDLPQLDTLQLDCIRMPTLTPSISCALAALTQLKTLRFQHCETLFSDMNR